MAVIKCSFGGIQYVAKSPGMDAHMKVSIRIPRKAMKWDQFFEQLEKGDDIDIELCATQLPIFKEPEAKLIPVPKSKKKDVKAAAAGDVEEEDEDLETPTDVDENQRVRIPKAPQQVTVPRVNTRLETPSRRAALQR